MRLRTLAASLALVFAIAPGCGGPGQQPTPKRADPLVHNPSDPSVPLVRRTAVDPKPINDTVKKGLAWLAQHQLDNGSWGQGDEAGTMRGSQPGNAGANVADSSMAVIAFLRSGSTPRGGQYANVVQKGLDYVMAEIEASDDRSLYVTAVRGTRVQSKIGQYADTFAALMLLTEARGTGKDGVANARIDAALKKVVNKVEKNQRENGSWDDNGWAPVLSQALAAKGLNRAAQTGIDVSKRVLMRVEASARAGGMSGKGSAGVMLYGAAADSSSIRDDASTKRSKAESMKAKAAKHYSPELQTPDIPTKAEIDAAEKDAKQAESAAMDNERQLVTQFQNKNFVAGFGNNGGEEYLSYLLISETMVQKGGDEWLKWDTAVAGLVGKVQNEDGSWTGHHCITGRTFCTAAALLVLMGDRTPATAVIAS
ncbi:MAG: terpene cyclase/mutase family protein [Deltaproteobacteria bacterium]|nr:terpene cyclase/mutase family protein [Deltaproteobacteria bacterium]